MINAQRWLFPVGMAFVLASSSVCSADLVSRRGAEEPLRGEVVMIDDEGVSIRLETGRTHRVLWDRVRDIEMDQPPSHLQERLEIAEDLWRARSRLERGDTVLAERLFERLFEHYRGRTHATALVVAEGLLRCRLARQEHALAVVPALETTRLRRAGVASDSYAMLPRIMDEVTELCEVLPPVWIHGPTTERLAVDLADYDARGDAIVDAMARLYAKSLEASAESEFTADRDVLRHPGVRLLRDLVMTRADTIEQRDASRARLMREVDSLPEWAEAWARYHIGISMLDEAEETRHPRGALNLAHLPARFARQQPFLAGLALARLIELMESDGNISAADSLRVDLAQRFPHHPIRTTQN